MNIKEVTNAAKEVSTAAIFKTENATATAIRIREGGVLKKHTTPIPAILVCIEGVVVYEDEKAACIELRPGSYIQIEPQIVHWLKAREECALILFK